ncbi:hypothetical protein HDC93_002766 [Streptomyces sp. AK010]|nr:hypothetical protein [Streptomyces sp. AK010]
MAVLLRLTLSANVAGPWTVRFLTTRSGMRTVTAVVRVWVRVTPPAVTSARSMKPVTVVRPRGVDQTRSLSRGTPAGVSPQCIVYFASEPSQRSTATSPFSTMIFSGAKFRNTNPAGNLSTSTAASLLVKLPFVLDELSMISMET